MVEPEKSQRKLAIGQQIKFLDIEDAKINPHSRLSYEHKFGN